jgi:hypothetical protein
LWAPALMSLLFAAGLLLAGCDTLTEDKEPPSERNPEAPPRAEANFQVIVKNTDKLYTDYRSGDPVLKSGTFGARVGGSDERESIGPGEAYEFTFTAGTLIEDQEPPHLSLFTRFISSNDLFYAFGSSGLDLYDEDTGEPRTGDVTSELSLYDFGSEDNEEPGAGDNQAPGGQCYPDDQGGNISQILGNTGEAGFTYPDVSEVLQATLSHSGDTQFTLRIENISDDTTLQPTTESEGQPVRLSAGVWAVHTDEIEFYNSSGDNGTPQLECLAEEGLTAPLADSIAVDKGIAMTLAPGILARHGGDYRLYETGQEVSSEFARYVETGLFRQFVSSLREEAGGAAEIRRFGPPSIGPIDPPIAPNDTVEIYLDASGGDYFTMMAALRQANDLFYTLGPEGIPLYEGGEPVERTVRSDEFMLYDAGTEVNEEPGVGQNQLIRQQNNFQAGEDESAGIRPISEVNDGFEYPDAPLRLRIRYIGDE